MNHIDFVQTMHKSTARNYVQRVVDHDKAHCSKIASQFGMDYWDGERQYGYGGYHYDGRWHSLAQTFVEHYGLTKDSRILDVGCGKGYLLYEFTRIIPGVHTTGLDISSYAVENSKKEIRDNLHQGSAESLPFKDNDFDFVVSLGTLHNLPLDKLQKAVREIERVGQDASKYIMVESWRNLSEKTNLLYWQLTCESFYSVDQWSKIYETNSYSGDFGFIYFE